MYIDLDYTSPYIQTQHTTEQDGIYGRGETEEVSALFKILEFRNVNKKKNVLASS